MASRDSFQHEPTIDHKLFPGHTDEANPLLVGYSRQNQKQNYPPLRSPIDLSHSSTGDSSTSQSTTENSSPYATPTPQRKSSFSIVNLEKLGKVTCDLIPDRFRSSVGIDLGRFKTIPATLTLTVITGLMVGPYIFPNTPTFAMALVILQGYLAYTALHMSYYSMKGIKRMKNTINRSFNAPKDLHHFVLIMNYKEDLSTLRGTIDALACQIDVDPRRSLTIVLGMEQREEGCVEKVRQLENEFGGCFRRIIGSYHPAGIPGERAGKAPNLVWSVKTLRQYLATSFSQGGPADRFDPDRCTVSILDADSMLANNYFSLLGSQFEKAGDAQDAIIWQSCVNCYENLDEIHGSTRFAAMIHSMHELSSLSAGRLMFPYSTYSTSLRLMSRIEGSDVNIFADDWHCYLKSLFANSGNVKVQPLMIPMRCYAAHAEGTVDAIKNRYQQAVRHCYGGAIEMAYLLRRIYNEPKRVPLYNLMPALANAFDIVFLVNFHFLIVGLPFIGLSGVPQFILIAVNYVSSASVCFAHYKYVRLLREDNASSSSSDGYSRRNSSSGLGAANTAASLEAGDSSARPVIPRGRVDWRLVVQVIVDLFLWGMVCSLLYGSLASMHAQFKLAFAGDLEYVVAGKHTSKNREAQDATTASTTTTSTSATTGSSRDTSSAPLTPIPSPVIKVDLLCDVDDDIIDALEVSEARSLIRDV